MKRYFFAGLVTLLPLAITVWVVVFIVNFLTRPFMGWVTEWVSVSPYLAFLNSNQAIRTFSQILILFALFLITLLLGFFARRFFFRSMLRLGDRILERLPLVSKVYKTTKEIIQSLFSAKKGSFKQVVLLRFPYETCYCIGLISNTSPTVTSKSGGKEMLTVFIPTTPNPTTGYMVMIPKSELIYLDMKTDQAIKYVVSCGVVQPPKGAK